jgi:hypothetical protein
VDKKGSSLQPNLRNLSFYRLLQQISAAIEVNHTDMPNQMRIPGKPRTNGAQIEKLKVLTFDDINEGNQWLWALIVVTTNKERPVINNFQSSNWTKYHCCPRFVWKIPLSGQLAQVYEHLNNDIFTTIFKHSRAVS